MSEVKKKVSWLSNIITAVVSLAVGIGATFGIISRDKQVDTVINTYVHAAATEAVAGYVDNSVALIEKDVKDEYKDKAEVLITAIQNKDFVGALQALEVIASEETQEDVKATIAVVKSEMEKGQNILNLITANNNEELRKLFPEAVTKARESLNIVGTENASTTENAPVVE